MWFFIIIDNGILEYYIEFGEVGKFNIYDKIVSYVN